MSQPPQPTPGEPKKRRPAEPKKMRRRFTGGPPVIKKFSARAGPRRIPDSAELGAMHVVMKSGAILPQGPQHKDFYKTVNLLLTCSAELEVVAVEVDNLEERRPLLDGVAAALDQALPLLRPSSSTDTDDEDPWAWKLTAVNVELKARKAESRLARALLAILRNLAQVPVNRGAIANHPVLLHHVLDLLEPELLGLESAAFAIDILVSVVKHVEMGGAFLEQPILRHYLLRGFDGDVATQRVLRAAAGLPGLAPPIHRCRRVEGGLCGDEPRLKARLARRVFRVIRAGLHFGAARDASTLLLPYQNDVSKVSVRLADSLRQPGALARLKMHQRHMALRSLEALGQLRSSEWNNVAFAKTPQDVAKLCRDRLAFHDLDDMRIVDSECRLAALEALLLLVDAGPLSAATVAARRNVVDLAAAVIAAAHARYAEPPALASGPLEPPAARPPVYEHARGGLCCVGRLPSDIAAPPLPPTDDTGDRLAPPRSVRAETVRIAAALLAALAHADIDARARVKALAPLLVPVAATDEAVADLLFTKLRAALGDGENPRSRRKVN